MNQVPLELLSHIFVLCDQATAYDKDDPKSYVQLVAPAVCRHWRKVALCTTKLWTTIRIKKPLPCKRAELYLARSGSTMPLDIKVVLMSPELPSEGELHVELGPFAIQARDIFSFITDHGGSVSRWRGLTIGTDMFATFAVMLNFLASTHLPSLEDLEFVFRGPWVEHPEDQNLFLNYYSSETKVLFSSSPPHLRSVKMEGILHRHLFGDVSRPQLVGLTDIYISFPGYHPSIHHIHSMLAANPGLISLCFNSEDIDPHEPDDEEGRVISSPRVNLPDLVSVSFMHITHPIWNLSVIKTFQAPRLQTLALSFWADPRSCQLLVDFISDQGKKSPPYFPATLSELSFFTVMGDEPDPEPLLRAYPDIATLRIGNIVALLIRPWLVPNLANLDFATQDASKIEDLILGRCGDGLPLKKVEVRWCGYVNTQPPSPEDMEHLRKMVDLVISTQERAAIEGEGDDS